MSLNKNKEDKKDEFENFINDNLNKFLSRDIYVTLTSYKLAISISAVIIDYNNGVIRIRLRDSKYVRNIAVKDPIVVNIANKGTIYSASTSVIYLDSVVMDLKIEKVTSKDNLRKEKRFLVSLRGEVCYKDTRSFIIIKNLSQNGLYFLSKLNIPLDSEILIMFITYEFLEVKLHGKIIRKNSLTDYYSYGISIEHIDDQSLKNLNVCIRNLINYFD